MDLLDECCILSCFVYMFVPDMNFVAMYIFSAFPSAVLADDTINRTAPRNPMLLSAAFDDDIEDMGNEDDVKREDEGDANRTIPQHLKKSNFLGEMHKKDVEEHKDTIPGTQKIYLKTYGCSHNVSDSEYMAGILQTYGYRITTNKNDADLWLVNSCTVKDPSQAAFMHLVNSGGST